MTAPIIEYVTEEVSRQGHDVQSLEDGLPRVRWMLEAWEYALEQVQGLYPTPKGRDIDLADVLRVGRLVEQVKNQDGLRDCRVRVGWNQTPDPEEVPRLLESLLENQGSFQPVGFYKEFEEIHPFVDGNGRTGKVLLNWLGRTLLAPVFPPRNLWGREIRNP